MMPTGDFGDDKVSTCIVKILCRCARISANQGEINTGRISEYACHIKMSTLYYGHTMLTKWRPLSWNITNTHFSAYFC